jgi:hypothetical protein
MAASTTIRISVDTRDSLKALAARRGGSAGGVVAELVHAADDDLLLGDAARDFSALAGDPRMLAAYVAEAGETAGAFDAPAPAW